MARPGPKNAITDIAGLLVGQAEDAAIRTGTTVILAQAPVVAGVCVAGGGPGTRETELLAAGTLVDHVDAVVLSGGSAFGLGAADGAASALKAMGRGFALMDVPGVPRVPIIPAAILYDLANGGDKAWTVSPYPVLGARAVAAACDDVREGGHGAGHGARAGAYPGGTGTASFTTTDGITVGAIACVNCFGSVYMPGTQAFWAWPYEQDGEFGGVRPPEGWQMDAEDWGEAKVNPALMQNTTLACVATDADLTPSEARRVAQMASAGFARAIRPVFAPFDGDVVFSLATARKPLGADRRPLAIARIGELAAAALARAIARGVHTRRTT